MKNEFVTYEQSLELKKLGFNIPTFCLWIVGNDGDVISQLYTKFENWNDHNFYVSSPLFQQVIDWVDINWDLLGYVIKYNNNTYDYEILNPNITEEIDHGDGPFETRQEAKRALISRLIETIKLLNK